MSESDATGSKESSARACRGTHVTQHRLEASDGVGFDYTARAGCLVLYERDRAAAEMFHVAYTRDDVAAGERPVTFVFNGGPGASAAYLHVGALGPRRVRFNDDGTSTPAPARLVDNAETWLRFTDLVFIDPIGTGFSRALGDDEGKEGEKKKGGGDGDDAQREDRAYWDVKRDLEALGEFIARYLSTQGRWTSPVFIAGESYGGYRVARMVRKLQEEQGVGLSGAILISPAIEFALLGGSDYDVLHWVDKLPTMAGAAFHFGKAQAKLGDTLEDHMNASERFARERLAVALTLGAAMPAAERRRLYEDMADLIGLPVELIAETHGRVTMTRFCRELLRDQRRVLGLYDATITAIDPFPDREVFEGGDPTLSGIGRMFTGAVNTHLRERLGVDEVRDYQLLNYDVFQSWRYENEGKQRQGFIGAMDDLRYGMAINPDTHVLISHGYFDLVTPYFSSDRLVDQMKLDPTLADRLTLRHFPGGHMFYTWRESRRRFFEEARRFYERACQG